MRYAFHVANLLAAVPPLIDLSFPRILFFAFGIVPVASVSTCSERNVATLASQKLTCTATLPSSPPSLIPIFQIFLLNQAFLNSLSTSPLAEYLISYPQAYLTSSRFVNSLANTRSNISAHYDISNEMFEAFLSADMTYSCGIFESLDEDLKLDMSVIPVRSGQHQFNTSNALGTVLEKSFVASRAVAPKYPQSPSGSDTPGTPSTDSVSVFDAKTPTDIGLATPTSSISTTPGDIRSLSLSDPLYDSQMRKLRHIIQKADIKAGHRVLEIGSGALFLSVLFLVVHMKCDGRSDSE